VQREIDLSLDAVIVAVTDDRPRILTVAATEGPAGIPTGPLEPERDPTLEIALRRWVQDQSGLELGYVEQLYTFGDLHRYRGSNASRHLSVAYLALVREEQPSPGAAWLDWYELLPWEDHRGGEPAVLTDQIIPELRRWAGDDPERLGRLQVTFGLDGVPWDPIRALERYELLYEADLVDEAFVDRGATAPEQLPAGRPLDADHRRIAATALGRLRGKLTYRPVVFELVPETFTLTGLQRVVESLIGIPIHKQNFRRLVEQGELVEGTGDYAESTGGRPAELFHFRQDVVSERPRPGVRVPTPRR
jgi:hypothetical protein